MSQNFNQQNGAPNSALNTPDTTAQYDPADIAKNKNISALAYLGILFFIPLVACPESKFGRYHANQGLVLLLLGIVVSIVFAILTSVMFWISWALLSVISILSTIAWLGILALCIIGIINTVNGKAKELPLIGKIKLIK